MTNISSLDNVRILIVEDERIIAQDIAQTLRGLSYEVCGIVDSGEEAVQRALELSPDLVLMDIHLRGKMDGIQAANQIHESLNVPVIFLTAYADDATLKRAKGDATYGYVLKPFEDRELQVATIMALCKHRAFMDLESKVQERTLELVKSEARFRQMAAVADLGGFALRTPELQPVLDRAVEVIAEVLGTNLAKVMELGGDGSTFLRAGAEWAEGLPGARLRVSVLSAASERPFGLLAAQLTSRDAFDTNEVDFLQAVANLIGATVARVRADERRLAAERSADEARIRTAHAQEALRIRDEFLSIASHELKTPLTALQLQLQTLTKRLASLDTEVISKLDRAKRSAERLAALVETLLDVSRFTTGKIELKTEPVDLRQLVAEMLDRMAETAERAHCAIAFVDDAEGALVGCWDRLRIEQTVLNLLANALKYAAGYPVEVKILRDGDAAELIVKDGGPGVTPAQIERIFDRFERAAPVRNYGGLGLGLYITRQIVEAHGGKVGVECREGGGASFIVRLPLDVGGQRRLQ